MGGFSRQYVAPLINELLKPKNKELDVAYNLRVFSNNIWGSKRIDPLPSKEKGDKINIHIHDLVKDSGKSEVKVEQKTDIKIDINIKIDLPAVQSDFRKFKREAAKLDDDLKEELEDIEDDLLEITPNSEQGKITKAINKLSSFMQELGDEDSKFNKIVRGSKKAVELGQKLGKTYNKFAQWLALPQVPDLFLGK